MELDSRVQNKRTQLMTLWVTRQNQEFVTTNDTSLCDVKLLSAIVNLTGERPSGNYISGIPGYLWNTSLYNLNGATHTYQGRTYSSMRTMRPSVNMKEVNIDIRGMFDNHLFRQDAIHKDNQLSLVVPTDIGFIGYYQEWPPSPIDFNAIRLEPKISVHSEFVGNAPSIDKQCIFLEDWADDEAYRRVNGKTVYFATSNYLNGSQPTQNDVDTPALTGGTYDCIHPSNLVSSIKLIFEITPRNIY